MATAIRPFGEHLRDWRQRRRLSQLDLALEAETSTRHLSFLETGRAKPSRDMLLRLAQTLEVPLRERNALLLAAGFAPVYGERPLDAPGDGQRQGCHRAAPSCVRTLSCAGGGSTLDRARLEQGCQGSYSTVPRLRCLRRRSTRCG
jgi:transcriptional regulator with XRE-family HTH domain